jgi:hypothetical protein
MFAPGELAQRHVRVTESHVVAGGQGPEPSPQRTSSHNPLPVLQVRGGRHPAMAQPPPPTQAAPAIAAVAAASTGPPVCTQGPVGPSHNISETQLESARVATTQPTVAKTS